MALGPFPPLAVKGTQESKARGGAQQQSQPGAGAAQDPQPRHDAPAARESHQEQAGGGRQIRERGPPTTHAEPLEISPCPDSEPSPNLDPKRPPAPRAELPRSSLLSNTPPKP